MSVLNYRDKKANDRIIYALTMEDVFDIAEELDIDKKTIEIPDVLERIYNLITTNMEHNWYNAIYDALNDI